MHRAARPAPSVSQLSGHPPSASVVALPAPVAPAPLPDDDAERSRRQNQPPRYLKQTEAATLPEYSNAEAEAIRASFSTGNCQPNNAACAVLCM
jgi:hypothetical protein